MSVLWISVLCVVLLIKILFIFKWTQYFPQPNICHHSFWNIKQPYLHPYLCKQDWSTEDQDFYTSLIMSLIVSRTYKFKRTIQIFDELYRATTYWKTLVLAASLMLRFVII